MLGLFKKKEKELVLTNEQKVALAKRKIEISFNTFKKMNDDIEEANATLKAVIDEETQRIIEIEKNRDLASDELHANLALQNQLKIFIK
jgi:hypothetical protein